MPHQNTFGSPEEALEHYGVKGMRWGVRNDQRPAGVNRRTNRRAKKDASEFTKAKMFYGEGAGTRRKLINKTVESRKKRDPAYAQAFDHHTENTDLSKRAAQARITRKRKDTTAGVRKTVRGGFHIINGNRQYANAAATLLVGGALYAHQNGIDKVVYNAAKTKYKTARNANSASDLADILRKAGMVK